MIQKGPEGILDSLHADPTSRLDVKVKMNVSLDISYTFKEPATSEVHSQHLPELGLASTCVPAHDSIQDLSIIPLNSFSYRGSGGLDNTDLWPMTGKFLNSADNFCAQARYLVHVAFVILRRNRSVASLLQKNTMVSSHFPLKVVPRPDCLKKSPQGLLRAVWSVLRASCRASWRASWRAS